ncbi:hypothetical protein GCM10025870_28630 [Agromyces marinus]|uniref:Uncharacterized protein n=1 Tax=Agromyces marinus TaxID=1389020 RepID=A0ABM8H4X4_9MICO|nr:hypothetical protein GCM10025870_28630 [Agromyces marinus]
MRPHRGLGVADLALAREEHEHVAGRFAPEFVECVEDAPLHVAVLSGGALVVVALARARPGGLGDERAVPHLDRVGAPGHLDDRGRLARAAGEVRGEALRVDRRARDDHAQVGAAGEEPLEVAEQEVDVEAALVRLVDDDRVVAAQVAVAVDLVEEDAVGHDLDARRLARSVGEPHLVADEVAELDAEFVGDPLGDGPRRDAAGLRVRDRLAPELEADLRQLRGLARAGRARDDDDLVVADGARDVVASTADRQVGRVRDRGGDGRGHSPPC